MSISSEILSLIDDIKYDRSHGASELSRQAAKLLKTAAWRSQAPTASEFLLEQKEIGERLISARPAMAPIFNIVIRIDDLIAEKAADTDLDSLRQLIGSKANETIVASLEAVAQIAQYGSQLIGDGNKIMTHSYSSTVMAALKEASSQHQDIEVIVARSGPGRAGERTAQGLGALGIPLTFIDDAAIGLYASTADKAVIGADRICADGGVVNGIGTCQLALACARAGIPFYVLCETLKFDPRLSSSEVDLEEKEPAEVVELNKLPSGVAVKNPYFDITPLDLVTGVVTENGLLTPEEVISYMKNSPC